MLNKGDYGVSEIKKSIRAEIEKCMHDKNCTMTRLSALSGIKVGHISEILNRRRAITIKQLDSFTEAFNCEIGWMYDLYVDECISEKRVSKPRLVPYLIRCAEIGRYDCIELAVSRLLEAPKNMESIFSIAEQLFQAGRQKGSAILYKAIVHNEKDNYSERFIISQYRLFRVLLGSNSEENWEAVIRFSPYRKRLPVNYQLDALLHLANTCYTLRKWELVEKYADELRELATLVYENKLHKLENSKNEKFETERHLVVYYGRGFLIKGIALENQELYEKAWEYVNGYADLSWFELQDEPGRIEIEKFSLWATANYFTLDILMGKAEILPSYVQFLDDHPDEILSGLMTILKSANQHKFFVDYVLDHFSENINSFEKIIPLDDAIKVSELIHFRYQLALYLVRKKEFKSALDSVLNCLILTDSIKDFDKFKSCTALFWDYLEYATEEQKKTYQEILKEDEGNEREITVSGISLGNV
ncbi:helix-turn-helix domain-containing protein [Brevibacillus sp. VP]|uniref:helix-turn-helix domain-containing protein n=1 Tax=unclassified Brevibacillus TaxID=2684853 RepID=UPI000E2EA461|nr:helix-turn-helix transcriptional regulator [Brevibacillus sp. VP]RFB28243.1 XRE family transcriptional regulator [Brevibacillus sp. VP]